MDNGIPPVRPDVLSVETAPRPTATPVRVPFSEVLAGGARALVRGAQAAVGALPGSPLMALAVRGGSASVPLSAPLSAGGRLAAGASPEGPGGNVLGGAGTLGSATSPAAGDPGSTGGDGLSSSIAQDEQMNLYYLGIQEQVNADNRQFSALSNVLEVEHNTAKTAIGNIH